MTTAGNWLSKGQDAFSKRLYHEAEDCFKKASEYDPFSPATHSRLGSVYWRQGKMEDAVNSLTRALELDPGNREAVLTCEEVLRSFGRLDDARLVLDSYIARNPGDREAQLRMEHLRDSSSDAGVLDAADFFTEQGESQFRKGRLDLARACFEMALEKDPHHATSLSNLGIVAWREGDSAAALDLLYKALDLKSDDPDILHNCFEVLEAVGEWESAAGLLQLYLQKGHGNQQDWDAYESLLRRSGLNGWSSQGLSKDAAAVYVEMGKALFLAGDTAGATSSFERAHMISPQDGGMHQQVAEMLLEAGEIDEAIGILEEGFALLPSHDGLGLMLARLLMSAGRRSEADVLIERALHSEEDPSRRAAWEELAPARAV